MITVTDNDFHPNFIEKLPSNQFSIMEFYGSRCIPCKMMASVINEVKNIYNDDLKIYTVNIEDAPIISQRYFIESVPKIFILKGNIIQRQLGVCSKEDLVNSIDEVMNDD